MMNRIWLGLVLGIVACDSGKSAAPDAAVASVASAKVSASASAKPPTPPPPPVPKGVKLTLDGKEIAFEHAWVYEANGPVVRLSTHAYGCSGDLDKAAVTLDFSLRPGPGGKHYATGKPVAVSMTYFPQDTDKKIPQDSWENGAQVTIEPFEYTVGGVVKGSLKVAFENEIDGKKFTYSGGGGFEAKICSAGDGGRFPAPETAPDAPVAGDVNGKPFKAQTVIIATADMSGYKWVDGIYLIDGPATCANYDSKETQSVKLRPRGANSREKLTGGPQEADVSVRGADGEVKSLPWSTEAWVQIDELAFDQDGVVKGRLALASQKVAQASDYIPMSLAGTFEGKVCQ